MAIEADLSRAPECGASIGIEARPALIAGVPDPTRTETLAPDPAKGKAGPGPTEDKTSRWMIAGIIVFILAGVAIFSACPACPACPNKEESLADKYVNMTEQQLIRFFAGKLQKRAAPSRPRQPSLGGNIYKDTSRA